MLPLEKNTKRPKIIEVGANMLAGYKQKTIVECARTMINKKRGWKNSFGDGKAGERIIKITIKTLNHKL
ncbi:UDP-N-acetylglucosamine 2-epimerase [Methanocella conradii]|uniref:UDP-N-acetylglucosamine 2-epimerase n=1 Tax=Methanocella conradii TaxID=1175444 RepID=UPI0024B33875|nr:UDP-N-acetylglucosamine 2-epimerase [Methanocella conradii]MDI6896831.1 UDP-N-acetylglucosamine 2-epimerase [Methanocella conradii]